jgi:hypothetical protein
MQFGASLFIVRIAGFPVGFCGVDAGSAVLTSGGNGGGSGAGVCGDEMVGSGVDGLFPGLGVEVCAETRNTARVINANSTVA